MNPYNTENLYENLVKKELNTSFIGRNIIHLDEVDSTNIYAKKIGRNSMDGTVVISEKQTSGRGRLGRKWQSQEGCLCMSIILRPSVSIQEISKITQVAAAAVFLALQEVNVKTMIKWPNDLLINGKKICGILTEMVTYKGEVDFIIVGIGLNINNKLEDLPQEIKNSAASVYSETGITLSKVEVTAKIMNNMEILYNEFISGNFRMALNICRDNSNAIGKRVNIIENNMLKAEVTVTDLGNDGELIVKYDNGETKSLIAGEISVRNV